MLSRRALCVLKSLLAATAIGLMATTSAALADDYRVLHHFAGGPDDGAHPFSTLTLAGSTLFGTTHQGGSSDKGTIFSIEVQGSGFRVMHSFANGSDDGAWPYYGALLLLGNRLYGMTQYGGIAGGANGPGTLFAIDTTGQNFSLVHKFGSLNDGKLPLDGLIQSGSLLYGTTRASSGNPSGGTVFQIDPDGNNYQILHKFTYKGTDGYEPQSALVIAGSTIFGTTALGGDTALHYNEGAGTIFQVNTDGSNFRTLHIFKGGLGGVTNDGAYVCSSLLLSGSALFGMTAQGGGAPGSLGSGTIYKIDTNGENYAVLHRFLGGPDDGSQPTGDLLQVGDKLFGMTKGGGTHSCGTVFEINLDGTGFEVLHSFDSTLGSYPSGSLIVSGSTLYGMAHGGGAYDSGVIFSLTVPHLVPEPASLSILALSASFLLTRRGSRRRGADGARRPLNGPS